MTHRLPWSPALCRCLLFCFETITKLWFLEKTMLHLVIHIAFSGFTLVWASNKVSQHRSRSIIALYIPVAFNFLFLAPLCTDRLTKNANWCELSFVCSWHVFTNMSLKRLATLYAFMLKNKSGQIALIQLDYDSTPIWGFMMYQTMITFKHLENI